MNNTLKTSLVLCDLDHLLLGTDGNLPQVLRDVMQLFSSRGGRLTVFSQRSPKAVRTILGSVRLAAPALVCGGTLAYQFATGTGQPLCSFAGREEAVLQKLPSAVGLGIALQMTDGSTRVLRMSEALEVHLRQEWTPYVLSSAADVRGEDVMRILLYQDKKQMPLVPLLDKALGEAADSLLAERVAPDLLVLTPGAVSGTAMFNAVCPPVGCAAEELTVVANCTQMLELMRLAGHSVVPADAAAELRLAAAQTTLTDHDTGAAAEYLYNLVRGAEATASNSSQVSCKLSAGDFLFVEVYTTMKEHTSTRKEKRFVLLTLLTAAACAALVFWFAVPLKGHTGQTAQPEPMIQAARVDLNTAGLDALCTLPGIGEKKARAILDYRRQNGTFRHVEDAVYVPGITSRIVESWQNLAYVS